MPKRTLNLMNRPWRQRLALALVLFAVALGLRFLLLPVESGLAFLTFYPAAVIAFFVLGTGPGWLITGLSAAAAYVVFTPPHWAVGINTNGLLAVAVYLVSAGLLSAVLARHRDTAAALEAAQQSLAAREREFSEREHFLRRLTDHMPVRLAHCDLDGRYRFVNQAHCQRFGLAREDILGRTRAELLGQPLDDAMQTRLLAVRQGQAQRFEYEEAVNGALRRFDAQLVPDVDAAGTVVGFFSTGLDVTDRALAQQQLADAASLLVRTGRVAGVGGWQYDLDTQVVVWSEQTRAIHGVGAGFVPTIDSALSFFDTPARATMAQALKATLARQKGWDLELPLTTADGRARWVRSVGEVEWQQGRPQRLVGALQDITHRHALELELSAMAARAEDLYDHAPCGYYSIDATGTFVRANPLTLSWLGCTREALIGQCKPTDFFTDAGRQLFAEQFPVYQQTGRVGPLEFELHARDGRVRWVSISATAIRDSEGRFVKSRSVMYDITEVHEARQALRRLNAEQAAMLDNDLVAIVKLRNRVAVWKNRALERLFGYTHEELIGQSSRQLYADDASYETLGRDAYAVLSAGGHYRGQTQMRHKSGELVWVDVRGFIISPEQGESMWLMTDISLLKAQQARAEHQAFHDALTDLPNRLLLTDRMVQGAALAERQQRMMMVCYLDLDGFKAVNDQHGHEAGDRLLQAVARRLEHSVRASDTVARLGGDEFVLVLTPLDSLAEGRQVVERVLDAVTLPVDVGAGQAARVSASIGIATCPHDGTLAEALLQRADAAMYDAKRKGKSRASGFSLAP